MEEAKAIDSHLDIHFLFEYFQDDSIMVQINEMVEIWTTYSLIFHKLKVRGSYKIDIWKVNDHGHNGTMLSYDYTDTRITYS